MTRNTARYIAKELYNESIDSYNLLIESGYTDDEAKLISEEIKCIEWTRFGMSMER